MEEVRFFGTTFSLPLCTTLKKTEQSPPPRAKTFIHLPRLFLSYLFLSSYFFTNDDFFIDRLTYGI